MSSSRHPTVFVDRGVFHYDPFASEALSCSHIVMEEERAESTAQAEQEQEEMAETAETPETAETAGTTKTLGMTRTAGTDPEEDSPNMIVYRKCSDSTTFPLCFPG
ncbi:hypothetical protein Q7C36_003513 [Tachysurus vachellii]|uniref:Uncharacterized protein n=1 Tax=Tachysurus vachellii TaxID=175792 RepID=A0AA88T7H1_TACVA|nr:hypothetical protein Q7C36_003513 [Tachysurus vachellii]